MLGTTTDDRGTKCVQPNVHTITFIVRISTSIFIVHTKRTFLYFTYLYGTYAIRRYVFRIFISFSLLFLHGAIRFRLVILIGVLVLVRTISTHTPLYTYVCTYVYISWKTFERRTIFNYIWQLRKTKIQSSRTRKFFVVYGKIKNKIEGKKSVALITSLSLKYT